MMSFFKTVESMQLRKVAARLLAAVLISLMLPGPELLAQATGAIMAKAPAMYHINILDGEGALNNVRERTAREPIIQIEDENHKPVAGVAVVFTAVHGVNGAGGSFNALDTYRTVTDADGKAIGRNFRPNTVTGNFTIEVVATIGATALAAVIHQSNSLGGAAGASDTTAVTGSSTGAATAGTIARQAPEKTQKRFFHLPPKWVIVSAVAGAAAVVAIVVTRQQDSAATVSPGGGTVAAPVARGGSGR